MTVLGDIASGEVDWADALFLIAAILFVVDALLRASRLPKDPTRGTLTPLGLTLVAVAFLLL
jgi:hypothetical protein